MVGSGLESTRSSGGGFGSGDGRKWCSISRKSFVAIARFSWMKQGKEVKAVYVSRHPTGAVGVAIQGQRQRTASTGNVFFRFAPKAGFEPVVTRAGAKLLPPVSLARKMAMESGFCRFFEGCVMSGLGAGPRLPCGSAGEEGMLHG